MNKWKADCSCSILIILQDTFFWHTRKMEVTMCQFKIIFLHLIVLKWYVDKLTYVHLFGLIIMNYQQDFFVRVASQDQKRRPGLVTKAHNSTGRFDATIIHN